MSRGSLLLSEGLKDIERINVGVNGVARKIKKAWVGIDGVARLCYEDSSTRQEILRPGIYKSTPTYQDHTCDGEILTGNGWDPSSPNPTPSSVGAEVQTLYLEQPMSPSYTPVSGTYDIYNYRGILEGTKTYSYEYIGEEVVFGITFKKYNALVKRTTYYDGFDRKNYFKYSTPDDTPAGSYPPIILSPYESMIETNKWKTARAFFNQRLKIIYIGTASTSGNPNNYLRITYREYQYYDWQGAAPDPNLWEYVRIGYVDNEDMTKGAYQIWREK